MRAAAAEEDVMKPLRALLYAFAMFRRRHRRFDPYRTTMIFARAALDLTGIRADLKCAPSPADTYTHRVEPLPEPPLPGPGRSLSGSRSIAA